MSEKSFGAESGSEAEPQKEGKEERAHVKIMRMGSVPAEATEVIVEKTELQNGKPILRFHLPRGTFTGYKADFENGEWVGYELD